MAIKLAVFLVTVRRVLARLAKKGLTNPNFGWCGSFGRGTERSFKQHARYAKEEKCRIAQAAATHIRPKQTLFLNSGTSAGALADDIAKQAQSLPGLTVSTTPLSVASKLCKFTPIRLILLGVELRCLSQGILGALAERILEGLTCDIAFYRGTL